MKKSLIALALVSAFAAPAFAQTAAPASEHTLTGNASVFSSYRFRGIDQTFGKPALQGGIDYSHSSGLYAGNWNSNVSEGAGYPGANLEMDFYGGYKAAFGDFGIDVGAIYYYYPGSDISGLANRGKTYSGAIDNKEIYIGASWKFLSLKYYHAIDDYFSAPDTKGTSYLDFSANYDLGNGWGVNGHVGHLNYKNYDNGSYTDWKLGVTKDVSGYVFGLSYIDTNAKGTCATGGGNAAGNVWCLANNVDQTGTAVASAKYKDSGRGVAVLSVTKSF